MNTNIAVMNKLFRVVKGSYKTTFFILLGVVNMAEAQSRWDIEVDPLAYVFKGFSVHVGYQVQKVRYDAGVFALEEPASLHKQQNFIHRGVGAGLKADYLFKSYEGAFVGISISSAQHTYTYVPEDTDVHRFELSSSLRMGYRFVLGKHFTIVPWGDIGYVLNNPELVIISGETFPTHRFKYFLTVHFGWKF
jgi:hypothetical protein